MFKNKKIIFPIIFILILLFIYLLIINSKYIIPGINSYSKINRQGVEKSAFGSNENIWHYKNIVSFSEDKNKYGPIKINIEINSNNKDISSLIKDFIKEDIIKTISLDNYDGKSNKDEIKFNQYLKETINFSSSINLISELDLNVDETGFFREAELVYNLKYFYNDNYISILIEKINNFNTIHPYSSFFVFNYNKQNREIKIKDLLLDFNLNEQTLLNKIINDNRFLEAIINDLEKEQIKKQIEMNQLKFYIKENKLHIIFDQCEILPCVAGPTDIYIY